MGVNLKSIYGLSDSEIGLILARLNMAAEPKGWEVKFIKGVKYGFHFTIINKKSSHKRFHAWSEGKAMEIIKSL
ncbi:MAG: hypothetical protein PUF37_07175 [Prevotellaceae bacterium]|nr:hypothetical protein [Prevotellaceae bacterium]